MALSIIIPALNEEAALPATLQNVAALDPAPLEIILVDGGSTDATVALARKAGVRVITDAGRGRAVQMNAGAAAATTGRFCFLHADTQLPTDFVTLTHCTLDDPKTALAAFISVMGDGTRVRRVTTAHNSIKTWYAPLLVKPHLFARGLRLVFGDQVMICRREDFEAIGGFDPAHAIMEEADFCLRMVRAGRGRVRQVPRKVWSSDRRVAEWGFWKANATYAGVGLKWLRGADTAEVKAKHYPDVR